MATAPAPLRLDAAVFTIVKECYPLAITIQHIYRAIQLRYPQLQSPTLLQDIIAVVRGGSVLVFAEGRNSNNEAVVTLRDYALAMYINERGRLAGHVAAAEEVLARMHIANEEIVENQRR